MLARTESLSSMTVSVVRMPHNLILNKIKLDLLDSQKQKHLPVLGGHYNLEHTSLGKKGKKINSSVNYWLHEEC